jgi:hypothetical protein
MRNIDPTQASTSLNSAATLFCGLQGEPLSLVGDAGELVCPRGSGAVMVLAIEGKV